MKKMKRKLPPRKKPITKEFKLPDYPAWEPPQHTNKQKVKDFVGGFVVMFHAALQPESKFDPEKTLEAWWNHAGLEDSDRPIPMLNSFVLIYASLYKKACKINQIELNNSFKILDSIITNEKFLSLPETKVKAVLGKLHTSISSHLKEGG